MNLATLTPLLISMLCALAGSLLVLKSVTPLANRMGLLDHPDDRKRHVGSIPLTGGIAITAGALFAFVIFQQIATTTTTTSYILMGGALMLVLGMIDDVNHFSWRKRLLGQLVISALTLKLTGLSVHTIAGFDLTTVPGLSLGFTLLAIIGLTNAFNLIDGIDGLAGGIALITIANLFIFSSPNVMLADGAYLVLIAAALLPYLYANVLGKKESKVFLGDSGIYDLGQIRPMSDAAVNKGRNKIHTREQPLQQTLIMRWSIDRTILRNRHKRTAQRVLKLLIMAIIETHCTIALHCPTDKLTLCC